MLSYYEVDDLASTGNTMWWITLQALAHCVTDDVVSTGKWTLRAVMPPKPARPLMRFTVMIFAIPPLKMLR